MTITFVVIMILLVTLSVLGCRIIASPDPGRETAETFMRAIGRRDEEEAISLLSTDTRSAVTEYCPGERLIGCFEEIGLQEWGTLERIQFDHGHASGGLGYSTSWSNGLIWVVIVIGEENGRYVVEGWRGFVSIDERGIPAGLLDGSNPINAFPPQE